MEKYELKAVALLFPGPRVWIAPGALYDPSRLGLGGGLEDLEILSLAARYRVAVYENRNEGGIQVVTSIAALQDSQFNSQMLGKRVVWYEWFNNSFIHHIQAAVLHFESVGLSKTDLRSS